MKRYSEFLSEIRGEGERYRFHHAETESTGGVIHHPDGKSATVTGIFTPEKHRGKGGVHHVMKQITDHLDKHKLRGHLLAAAIDDGMQTHRLKTLYAKHGFKETEHSRMERESR